MMIQRRREMLSWEDVDQLIDHLLPQFERAFDAMIMITRGGIIPGGLLAEALGIQSIFTASVDFPSELADTGKPRLLAWPKFLEFPQEFLLVEKKILIVDDVWGSGRTITAVKNRAAAAGGLPFTCVLHFNPYRNLFDSSKPDYYAAITDAHIIYPWELGRSTLGTFLTDG